MTDIFWNRADTRVMTLGRGEIVVGVGNAEQDMPQLIIAPSPFGAGMIGHAPEIPEYLRLRDGVILKFTDRGAIEQLIADLSELLLTADAIAERGAS